MVFTRRNFGSLQSLQLSTQESFPRGISSEDREKRNEGATSPSRVTARRPPPLSLPFPSQRRQDPLADLCEAEISPILPFSRFSGYLEPCLWGEEELSAVLISSSFGDGLLPPPRLTSHCSSTSPSRSAQIAEVLERSAPDFDHLFVGLAVRSLHMDGETSCELALLPRSFPLPFSLLRTTALSLLPPNCSCTSQHRMVWIAIERMVRFSAGAAKEDE